MGVSQAERGAKECLGVEETACEQVLYVHLQVQYDFGLILDIFNSYKEYTTYMNCAI